MLYICIGSNKFDLIQAIRVPHIWFCTVLSHSSPKLFVDDEYRYSLVETRRKKSESRHLFAKWQKNKKIVDSWYKHPRLAFTKLIANFFRAPYQKRYPGQNSKYYEKHVLLESSPIYYWVYKYTTCHHYTNIIKMV